MKMTKRLWSILLSLVMVLGLMPGMSLAGYAGDPAYAAYDVTTDANKSKTGDALTALQVTFNGMNWYIIEDYSIAADTGTVTLLAADNIFDTNSFGTSKFGSSNDYSTSTVKGYLDDIVNGTAGEGKPNFKDVADVIVTNTDAGGKLYLLSIDEIGQLNLSSDVLEMNFTGGDAEYGEWWLRSPGTNGDSFATFVYGDDSSLGDEGLSVDMELGVRPALKLNLSSVIFSSESKTFSLLADGDTSYTLTIPSTLNVANSGWNATDGISATGTLASGKKLTVTATSANSWALKSGDNSVGYILAAASTDTTATTSWEFDTLSNTATTKTMGIIVDDYSTKPAGTYQDTVTFTASVEDAAPAQNIVDLSTLTAAYEAQDGDVLINALSGDYKITIADGATVTLRDATITCLTVEAEFAGITPSGDATILLEGTNVVKGGFVDYGGGSIYSDFPGISAPADADHTLTIDGEGSLTASKGDDYNGNKGQGCGIGVAGWAAGNIVIKGGNITATGGTYAAGIGGGLERSCGDITITGGNITATGGSYAAGIGGGNTGSCGAITITGGTVNATGGEMGAGIGSGECESCGAITITGGTVNATGGNSAAGIGSGEYGSCVSITIADTVTSVTATKGSNAPNSIGAGKDGSCGTVTIGGVEGAITQSSYTYEPN